MIKIEAAAAVDRKQHFEGMSGGDTHKKTKK
jgi:hypothetical protein